MKRRSGSPRHQPETEFIGDVQVFVGPALSPDDPRIAGRVSRGRPGDAKGKSKGKMKDNRRKPFDKD
jgi:hypothetical protein